LRTLLLLLPLTATPALAGGARPVTFCLQVGAGGGVAGGVVQVWAERLEIRASKANTWTAGEDGCAEVEALDWDGRRLPLTAWLKLSYTAEAEGFHPQSGRYVIQKSKRKNRLVLLLEPRA
jgi:hypothetical protein